MTKSRSATMMRYDAHVLGEAQQQLAEVLRLDGGVASVQPLHLSQAVDDAVHRGVEAVVDFGGGDASPFHLVVQQHAQHGGLAEAYLVEDDLHDLQAVGRGASRQRGGGCGFRVERGQQRAQRTPFVVAEQPAVAQQQLPVSVGDGGVHDVLL